MKIEIDNTYTIKMNSGEELIAKVKSVEEDVILVEEPMSVAPGPQGMGLIPSLFTSETHSLIRINTSCISMIANTEDSIKMKYLEATVGLKIPTKKIVMG